MKKLAFIMALILASLPLLVSCSNNEDEAPDGMKLVTNDIVNYKLYVPETWTESISTGVVGAYCSNSDITNVTVMAWNVESGETLDTWWEKAQTDFNIILDDMQLSSTETTTLGGVAANKYSYTAKLGENEYSFVQVACLHWSMVYVLTVTSLTDLIGSHTEDIEDMITYFEFD